MATVNFTGVIEDGTPVNLRSSAAPLNPRVTLSITQQTSLTVNILILKASGQPVDVTNAVGQLTIRKTPQDSYVLRKFATQNVQMGRGWMQVMFAPNDTLPNRWPWGIYTWMFKLTNGDGSIDVPIPLSPCIISPTNGYP